MLRGRDRSGGHATMHVTVDFFYFVYIKKNQKKENVKDTGKGIRDQKSNPRDCIRDFFV